MDNGRLEKLTRALSSGELKRYMQIFIVSIITVQSLKNVSLKGVRGFDYKKYHLFKACWKNKFNYMQIFPLID
jgi:hypothetical protein